MKMTGRFTGLSDPLRTLSKLTVRSCIILKQIETESNNLASLRFVSKAFIENSEMREREDFILLFVGSN